jgi:probable HAF family extracellular repeat protein
MLTWIRSRLNVSVHHPSTFRPMLEPLQNRLVPGGLLLDPSFGWESPVFAPLDAPTEPVEFRKALQRSDAASGNTDTTASIVRDSRSPGSIAYVDARGNPAGTTEGTAQPSAASPTHDINYGLWQAASAQGTGTQGPHVASASFIPLGVPGTQVTDMVGDGSFVVGTTAGGISFLWAYGEYLVGPVFGATSISDDGTILVSTTQNGEGIRTASIWQGDTNWYDLGGCEQGMVVGGTLSSAYATSGDGSVVVGLCWVQGTRAHAFRWEPETGMVDLGVLGPRSSRANAVSSDNSTVVGWDEAPTGYRRGAVWQEGGEWLLDPEGNAGEAFNVSSDGRYIVGTGHPQANDSAYLWSAEGGFTDLGTLQGFSWRGYAYDVSDDGNVVVGFSGFGGDRDAFLWSPTLGMVKLADHLTAQGVDLTGWRLSSALTVSNDGRFIGGWGVHGLAVEGWLVDLGSP